jgi:hypothetical protein
MMELAVMLTAERYSEFVARLQTEPSGLCEAEVMRVGGSLRTSEAGLKPDEPKVLFIPDPSRLWMGEDALVDRRDSSRCEIASSRWSRGGGRLRALYPPRRFGR